MRALYGLRSAGASSRAFLVEHLDSIGLRSSVAEPDVWLRLARKPDGGEYYEYILIHVDDVMALSHDTDRIMKQIKEKFNFKGDKWVEPEIYLGANIGSKIHNGVKLWTISSREYLKAAITKVEGKLYKEGKRICTKARTSISSNYKPDLDETTELKGEEITY